MADYYVDQTSGDNGNAGTSGSPWATLDYAINTGITAQGSEGDNIYIKGTGSLGATPDPVANIGAYNEAKPLKVIGYGTTVGDMVHPQITVGSTYALSADLNADGLQWVHLDVVFSSSASYCIYADNYCAVLDCRFSRGADVTGPYINMDEFSTVMNCRFQDLGLGNGIQLDSGIVAFNEVIEQFTYSRAINNAISPQWGPTFLFRNTIKLATNGAVGIFCRSNCHAWWNSIYQNGAGVDVGISFVTGDDNWSVLNNAIEGFSGTGGAGLRLPANTHGLIVAGNTIDDCATAIDDSTDSLTIKTDNDTSPGASPFTSPATNDFTPSAVASLDEGNWPGIIGPLDG